MTEKKPWCIYGSSTYQLSGIGKIVEQIKGEDFIFVRYHENQLHGHLWKKTNIERFSSPEEAIQAFSKRTKKSVEEVKKEFLINFSSQRLEL